MRRNLRGVQTVHKVIHQIACVLKSDREPEQPVGYSVRFVRATDVSDVGRLDAVQEAADGKFLRENVGRVRMNPYTLPHRHAQSVFFFMAREACMSLALLAVAISAGCVTPSLGAQQPRPAQQAPPVRAPELSGAVGVVLDSINGGVLAGATILLEGTGVSARTDTAGEFRLDSISPGTHRLVLRHPLADSIGFEIASAPIEMLPGRYAVVAMAVPSSATLRRILCSPRDTSSETAILVGRVTDPETDSAIVGARVSFLYQHLLISGDSGVRRTNRLRETTTGNDGRYAICGLPQEVAGTLQAVNYSLATPEVPIRRGDRSILFRNLTIARVPRVALQGAQPPGAALAAPSDVSPSTGYPPRSGRAVLEGRVVDTDGAVVAGAQVTVVGTAELAVTGEDGTFALDGLPSGTSEVVARKIGLAAASGIVELTTREPQRVTLTLNKALAQTLETVTVRAPMAERLRRVGFEDRRRVGLGRFMDAEQIERRQPMHVTDVLRSFPGFRIVESESGRTIVPVRSATGQSASCVNIFVDGARVDMPDPGDMDRMFHVSEIAAVETYAGDFAPQQFTVPARTCATIVIWTKAKLDER